MRHQAQAYSHTNRLFATLLAVFTISCLLTNTAAGSCLQYGHSCWGAHGKRSNIAPAAQPSDLQQQQPDSLAPPSDDSAASSWEPIEEPSVSADEYLPAREAAVAWQRLRRPMHQRSRPRAVIRRDDPNDDDYEAPPPRWLYQIMRQSANKMD